MQHDWKHVERPGESHTALDCDMTTSNGNGDWNLDAVENSGHRCTKCGSRKHGASMCDADLTNRKGGELEKLNLKVR